MIASIEDSIGILSKWANESTSLLAVFVMGGLSVSLEGFIRHLLPNTVVVTLRESSTADLTVTLDKVIEYDYTESKRAPQSLMGDLSREYTACLTLKLATGIKCFLYELAA
jgi:hypothetical protein